MSTTWTPPDTVDPAVIELHTQMRLREAEEFRQQEAENASTQDNSNS